MLKIDLAFRHFIILGILSIGLALLLSTGPSMPIAHAKGLFGGAIGLEQLGRQTSLAGRVTDSQGEPITEAEIRLVLNGKTFNEQEDAPLAESQSDGTFVLAMEINPLSLLLPEVLASNVGGISTLIGTPTNILIGSYAGLSFNDFLTKLTPGVLVAQAALTLYVILRYRAQFLVRSKGPSQTLLERLRESGQITQPAKLRKARVIFGGTLLLFVLGERFHLVPAVTAILGAVAMLLWVTPDIESMLKVVDWTTLMFFISLFIVVGAIPEVGLISIIAETIGKIVGDNLTMAMVVIVWASAFLSGVIANIPFTAAMLPVVGFLTRTIPGASSGALFFALSVGSAMGGNSSLIGASANLVTAGIAERAGYRITYAEFFKVGMPAMIITVVVGTLWLLLQF
jgi:Na+/H+ antiporter NhaD/arsenite permease-like protein